jgi:laminin alpha 3/5
LAITGDKCEACPYRWVLVPDQGCFECDSCSHNLLDVTDELRIIVDPIVGEFQTVALTFFTHQKLTSLNQSALDLRAEVGNLDVSQIQFGPLEAVTVELEATSRGLKIKTGYVEEESMEKAHEANNALIESVEVEKLIQEAVQKSRSIIGEVAVLAESLEGGAGPQIDKALGEAQVMLQEIRSRNFQQRQSGADHELQEAISLLGKMKEEALPVRDNSILLANLTTRLSDLIIRVMDLSKNIDGTKNNVKMADKLTNANRVSSSLGAVADIQQRNTTASAHLKNCAQVLYNATALMESARKTLDQLKLDIDRLMTSKNTLHEAVEQKETDLAESRKILYDAQIHATKLGDQAAGLDEMLTDTRQTSENAVSAANSYKNIVDAIDEAIKAAEQATNAGLNATQLSSGVGERAQLSHQRSKELLAQAGDALQRTQTMLKPRLMAAETLSNLVEENNQRTAEGLKAVNDALDKIIPTGSAKQNGRKAVETSTGAQQGGSEASAKIQEVSNQIPMQRDRTNQLARDIDTVGKSTTFSLSNLERLNAVLPDLRNLLTRSKEKQAVLSVMGKDLSAKLAELRQKTALARDQANRITVGVTFYHNSTLQLHNPEGLSRAATANQFSLYFRTADTNGFLAYLGNEVGTSKKLRRTRSDDFMTLEIRNGYLTLTTDLGSGPQSVTNDRLVSDNVWYQAVVQRTGKSVRLTVRAEKEAGEVEITTKEAVLPGTFSVFNLDQDLSKIFIGGYPQKANIQPTVLYASFRGEVEEVMIGDTAVGLWNFVDAANIYGAVERDKLKNLQESTGYRFDGEGYATLDRKSYRFRDRVDVQLKFKSTADNGLLFLAGKGKEFMSIELNKGKVVYRYNLGDDTITLKSPEKYNDDKWHTIEAVRRLRDGILKVSNFLIMTISFKT